MKYIHFCFLFLLLGCTGVNVTPVHDAAPLPVPEGSKPSVIALSTIKTLIPRGKETIGFGPESFWQLLSCDGPWGSVQSSSIGTYVVMTNIRRRFADTLESLGYDISGNPGILFDEMEDYMRTRYRIGARIVDSTISMCSQSHEWMRLDSRVKGEANVEIEWVVYDGLRKKTVYKTRHKGYGKLPKSYGEGAAMLLEEAFASAAHGLGTDPVFHDLIFKGIEPQIEDKDLGIDAQKRQDEDWETPITLPKQKPLSGNRFEKMKKSAVLIETGAGGHGSGFFIADDLIITNAHVVGFAQDVRVSTSMKKDKFIARVIRTDPLRDIALIRLEDPIDPKDYTIAPINPTRPNTGETVFAVGAPRLKKLQDTVTSGIVSGWRYDKKERQHYIQADVDVYPGNSGGPLYNDKGEVIGVSVMGFFIADNDAMGGLNWFIPIHDALTKLDVGIE